ncbi:MAG: hypothetical protein RL150_170 [Candidatus Parcubacteria bacterium]|jgi:RsiW-degrading membrane proteinase PrsW (M82 family)
MPTFQTIIFAFLGGVLPAIVWLTFWLREDDEHPEPNKNLILSFLFGMLAVPVALALQLFVNHFFLADQDIAQTMLSAPVTGFIVLVIWSITEELGKYWAAFHGGLKWDSDDEPMDDVIYMITAALGFAALENALYLFGPLFDGNTELAIATGNMRFIGATLLHVAAAALIGIFRAFSHFKLNEVKKRYLFSGIILAITLHALFNFFIMIHTESMFFAFSSVWILIVVIIFIFEKIKAMHVEQIKP